MAVLVSVDVGVLVSVLVGVDVAVLVDVDVRQLVFSIFVKSLAKLRKLRRTSFPSIKIALPSGALTARWPLAFSPKIPGLATFDGNCSSALSNGLRWAHLTQCRE